MSCLPPKWADAPLSEACSVIRGITFPTSAKELTRTAGNVLCLRTTNIQREIDWKDVYFVPRNFVKRDDQKALLHGEADWEDAELGDVAEIGTGSTPLRSNPGYFAATGTPWVTSAATASTVITSASEFVTADAIKAHRLKLFPAGTLLVAMYGEGKTRGQVSELAIAATINQACAAITVTGPRASKGFVKLALQANYLAMRSMAEGGNQPNLNLSKVRSVPLPLPSLTEQAEVVRRVGALFAIADRLEARLGQLRKSTDRLTPATLAKAFRGELVPQDPNDEPAEVLLARIRAGRDVAAAAPRKPRATTAST